MTHFHIPRAKRNPSVINAIKFISIITQINLNLLVCTEMTNKLLIFTILSTIDATKLLNCCCYRPMICTRYKHIFNKTHFSSLIWIFWRTSLAEQYNDVLAVFLRFSFLQKAIFCPAKLIRMRKWRNCWSLYSFGSISYSPV